MASFISHGVSGVPVQLNTDYTSTHIKVLLVKKCKYSTKVKIIDSQFVLGGLLWFSK